MGKPGPKPKITPEDVLEVFRDRADPAEPLTAPEVADALGCSRRTALDRLRELGERDVLASKKVGGRSRVWWLAPLPADSPDPGEATAADRLGGFGMFAGEDGEAFAEAVARARAELGAGLEERQDALFGE